MNKKIILVLLVSFVGLIILIEACSSQSTKLNNNCGDKICSIVEKQTGKCQQDCIQKNQPIVKVDGFEECTKAGNPVTMSYPRQCRTSDGKVYIEGQTSDLNMNELSSIVFFKKITIDNGARPEIIASTNKVFVVYRDNINNAFSLKIFDENMNNKIVSKILVESSTDYGSPTDIRVASDENYLYTFYETSKASIEKTYLFGAKYTLDNNFERVAFTNLIKEGEVEKVGQEQEGVELLNDPITLIGENSVFAITRYRTSLGKEGYTKYKVYEFTKDLVKIREFDIDLSSIADGEARQASAIYHNGYYYMAVPTTIGNAGAIPDNTPSNIVMAKLDTNWGIIESKDISTDASNPNDVETYIMGLQADSNNFYLVYNQIDTAHIDTGFTSPIKIYDKNFNLVINQIIKIKKTDEFSLRPSLEVLNDKIYIGHSSGGLGKGNAEIYIYEIKRG